MASDDLNKDLSKKTEVFGLMVWKVIGICVGLFIIIILCLLSLCLSSRKKSRKERNTIPISQIPAVSKDIKTIRVEKVLIPNDHSFTEDGIQEKISMKSRDSLEKITGCESQLSGDEGSSISICTTVTNYRLCSSPMFDLPEYLGWGYWFTMRELDIATNFFSKENVIGEGGYGVVYKGCLLNGTPVAVKKILNNQGQAEQEFRVEVEAIGHVRHKNLVRLLGYCIEGIHRMLVYEYVNNGNLELWLHGAVDQTHNEYLTWEARIKILLGTAKGLTYLHEAIEPKVVHRDIKSSNILIDDDFNAKVSDFGLAKLLDAGKTHVTTRVMGTFGYVAPEYANTGLLSEKSDVYSFGVVILETITGRDPVDYERPAKEVNLIDWMKLMVGSRQFEELIDPNIRERPSTRALKRLLLVALRCVDQDYEKRPKMGQVVRMLESEKLYFTSRH